MSSETLSHSLSGSISRPGCCWLPCCFWHTPNSFFLSDPGFIARLPRMKHTLPSCPFDCLTPVFQLLQDAMSSHTCRQPCVIYHPAHTPISTGPAVLFKADVVYVVTVTVDSHFWIVNSLNQGLELCMVLCPGP